MKRIFSLFAAVLFAALILASPAALAGGGPVVFSMNSVENVSPGESFTITLSISGDYQAHGMNLSIEFDPNSMTLESCDQGDYLNAVRAKSALVVLDSETLAHEGKIKLAVAMPMDAATGSGDVLIMRFHVNPGVTVNQQVIMIIQEFIYMPVNQMTGTDIPFSTHNSIIALRGGSIPKAGYNEGDDGIGNNISSSLSQPPAPTPGGNTAPGATDPDSTPQSASESGQPGSEITASPDGAVTASPADSGENADASDAQAGDVTAEPGATEAPKNGESGQKNDDSRSSCKISPVPYIVAGVAGVGAVCAALAVLAKKKRG